MGSTNEVLRQFFGKLALLGIDSLDYWNQHVNERVIHNEINKLNLEDKKELAATLLAQVADEEAKNTPKVLQETPG
ncbi:hypothetical protein [Gloeocapsopsis crepidinum]|uniref:hypothetical protein n=1 Tax=Gloeocapsopsis crepidinum TaxID=693223 RepID=UPI001D15540E|nr:hypothetical protein [Gloeocapsopsis crepidinum]